MLKEVATCQHQSINIAMHHDVKIMMQHDVKILVLCMTQDLWADWPTHDTAKEVDHASTVK